jgi:hypothetical protein
MITIKVLASALVVTAAKASSREMKTLANAVTKNKAQRRVLLNEIDVLFQNSMIGSIYVARQKELGSIQPIHRMGANSFKRSLRTLCAAYYDSAFAQDIPYTEVLDVLVNAYNEHVEKSSVEDLNNVKSIIADAVGGDDKVWVGNTCGWHNKSSSIEILSPATDLEAWVEGQTDPKPLEVEAGDLYNWHFDREQFNKDHVKEGERGNFGHYCCSYYQNVENNKFITLTELETLQGSKVKLVGYNQRYNDREFGPF